MRATRFTSPRVFGRHLVAVDAMRLGASLWYIVIKMIVALRSDLKV
jgi:hypothetical protein